MQSLKDIRSCSLSQTCHVVSQGHQVMQSLTDMSCSLTDNTPGSLWRITGKAVCHGQQVFQSLADNKPGSL